MSTAHLHQTVRRLGTRTFFFFLAWALAACGNGGGGSDRTDSGPGNGGPDGTTGPDDSAVAMTRDASEPSDGPTEQSATANVDSGVAAMEAGGTPTDGGGMPIDGGLANDAGTDGTSGVRDVGSCCMMQSTPGCSNASLEVCVCEKDPSCCTTAWSAPCVLIVQQKYCQPGVRDCVCGSDAGQWGQADCCNTDWTSTCDSVATLKCNAVQGCF
jgi:hypothetical protein